MEVKQVKLIYFSPTGTTQKVLLKVSLLNMSSILI